MSRDYIEDPAEDQAFSLRSIAESLGMLTHPMMVLNTSEVDGDAYLKAADDVAKERVRFAEAFLLRKARTGTSDGQAREQAIVDTNDELTRALARQDIARRRLDMGRAG